MFLSAWINFGRGGYLKEPGCFGIYHFLCQPLEMHGAQLTTRKRPVTIDKGTDLQVQSAPFFLQGFGLLFH